MALGIDGEFLWDDFYKSFIDGGYHEFLYQDKYLNLGCEIKGVIHKVKRWIFVVHKHNNTGADIYAEYKTSDLLLENARIDGKSIREIWDELTIA